MAGFVIAPALPDFLRANPKITISLDCGFWPDSPLSSEVDIALQFDPVSNPDVQATPVATFHYGLYAARSYIDLYGAPTTPAQCADHRYVHHPAQKRQKDKWGPKTEAFQMLANVSFESNSSAATLMAIKNGAGIGALPTAIHAVDPDLVMLDLPPSPRPSSDVHAPRRRPHRPDQAGGRLAGRGLRPEGQALVPGRVHPSARIRRLGPAGQGAAGGLGPHGIYTRKHV